MANIKEVDSSALISAVSSRLKEAGIQKPYYVGFTKTGPGKERVPQDENFWYIRCASILRQVYLNGPIGVSKLRTYYGSKKGHVVSRHHHYRAGGSIIKDAFEALEKAGYIKKGKSGRTITPSGRAFLDKISNEIAKKSGA